jgi:hypothetical protein
LRAAELEHDNDDKIAGLAEAQASAARELARLDGVAPDSPEEAAILNGARSQIPRTSIEQRIDEGMTGAGQIMGSLGHSDYSIYITGKKPISSSGAYPP